MNQTKKILGNLFHKVKPSFYRNTPPEAWDFLVDVINEYKIDVSSFVLCCSPIEGISANVEGNYTEFVTEDFYLKLLDDAIKLGDKDYLKMRQEGRNHLSFCDYKNEKFRKYPRIKPQDIDDMKFIMLHELGHVQQFIAGRSFNNDEGLGWRVGEEVIMFPIEYTHFALRNFIWYNSLPWEYDANLFVLNSKFCPQSGLGAQATETLQFIKNSEFLKTQAGQDEQTDEAIDLLNPATVLTNLERLYRDYIEHEIIKNAISKILEGNGFTLEDFLEGKGFEPVQKQIKSVKV